jgi:ABC-type polar amino acid transport system ATPase subunit
MRISQHLAASSLFKGYGGKPVLRGVDISVLPGTVTAIIGPNGSGKSTVLRALALLDPPDSGRVEVDEAVYKFPSDQVIQPPWPRITLVFQQLFLWPHLTIRQNITLPRSNLPAGSSSISFEELTEIFTLGSLLERYPNEISGGQRQRAALARALGVEPSYLLLDEVTSALDVEQIGNLLGQIDLLKKRGIAIVLVTHLIGFARAIADQVIFLWEGTVSEQGDRQILSNPKTEQLQRFLSIVQVNRDGL